MRFVLVVLAVVLLGLLAASFGGRVHPLGDSLSVFRLPLAMLAGLAVVWTGWGRAVRWPLTVLCLGVVAWHGWMTRAEAPVPGLSMQLYQKNMLFRMSDRDSFVADIHAMSPDFITLQEVSKANLPVLEQLRHKYPSQAYCPFARVGGVAVLSRWPKVEGSEICAKGNGMVAMQVQGPSGPVWLVSLHLHWPWPHEQADHISRLEPLLSSLEGPVLVGGDFNAVAWSHAVARVEAATGTRRVGPHMNTFVLPYIAMGVGIDHVLASPPQNAVLTRRDRLGSDHFGVLARIAVP